MDNLRNKQFFGLSDGNLRLFAPIRDNPECQDENRTCKMFEQIKKPGNTYSAHILKYDPNLVTHFCTLYRSRPITTLLRSGSELPFDQA